MASGEQNLKNVPGSEPNQPRAHAQTHSSFKPSFRWFADGLNDWVNLLGKPQCGAIFNHPPDFKWVSLLRLIVVVLSLSGAILGVVLVVFDANLVKVIFQKWPATVLVCGALVTVLYTCIAWAFRVTITVRDALFSILLLSLPWLSLSAALYFLVMTAPKMFLPWLGLFLFFWIWLVPILLTRNLCHGIKILVPGAQKWRIYCSVIVWMVLLLGSFILIVVFVSVPQPIHLTEKS